MQSYGSPRTPVTLFAGLHLPGINGLETLARIHQRKPDLPVVMMSSASSPQVAIAAFHGGVADYVLKTLGFTDVVAQRVQQFVRPHTAATQLPSPVTSTNIPRSEERR